jgi:CRP-like cAMP-binding protein
MLAQNLTHKRLQDEYTEGRRLHFYDRAEEIPLVKDGIWQVYRGVAQLSQLSLNGEEILLGWAQPETFFGLWMTHLELYQAKALSELYLRWYPLNEIEASPHLAQTVLTQVMRRMRQTESLLAIAGARRVEDKLQELLVLLKNELGQPVAEGTRITVRLTHQNLANAIGTTRVTVTRLIGNFQRQGLVSLDSDRHLIVR